jgi:hypothetical protein
MKMREESDRLLSNRPQYNTLQIRMNSHQPSPPPTFANESINDSAYETVSLMSTNANYFEKSELDYSTDLKKPKKGQIQSTKAALFPVVYLIISTVTILISVIFYYIEIKALKDMLRLKNLPALVALPHIKPMFFQVFFSQSLKFSSGARYRSRFAS